jgi:hypothetical protein
MSAFSAPGFSSRIAVAWLTMLVASSAAAQEAFRCTAADGKVTYQQVPCPKASEGRPVDITPANTGYDPAKREQILKQGDEAGRKLQARAEEEAAEQRRRAEAAARLERETREREEAREQPPDFVYARRPGWQPSPYPPPRPSQLPVPPRGPHAQPATK